MSTGILTLHLTEELQTPLEAFQDTPLQNQVLHQKEQQIEVLTTNLQGQQGVLQTREQQEVLLQEVVLVDLLQGAVEVLLHQEKEGNNKISL